MFSQQNKPVAVTIVVKVNAIVYQLVPYLQERDTFCLNLAATVAMFP